MSSCVDSTYDYNSNVIIPMLLLIGGRSWHRAISSSLAKQQITPSSGTRCSMPSSTAAPIIALLKGEFLPAPWISGCCRRWQWVWWHCVYVWQLCTGEGMDVCHNSRRWLRLLCLPSHHFWVNFFFLNISFIFVLCVRMICLSLCVYASHECPVSTEARRSTRSLELYSQTVVNHNTSTGN